MKKITLKIKTDITKLPNKMHFEIQKATRAQIFRDKKREAKNGYRKHKGQEDVN